jgi:hypothetical protein
VFYTKLLKLHHLGHDTLKLVLTFGGMCSWRPDASGRWRAVPRIERSEGRGVFALVVRCRNMRLLLYSRVGKNRDTSGSPRREPGRPAPPLKLFHFDQKILAVQKPMTYTDLLPAGLITSSLHFTRILPGVKYISY